MKTIAYTSVLSLLPVLAAAQISSQRTTSPLPDPARLQALSIQLAAGQQASRTAALQWAAQRALPVQGQGWALKGLTSGEPEYVSHDNTAAAGVVRANVLAAAPYGLTGNGVRIGMWESGRPLVGHIESPTLIWQEQNSPFGLRNHANHVAGTLAGLGLNQAARGMAPGATVFGWDSFDDLAEMAASASLGPGVGVTLSNHSYSQLKGWRNYPADRAVTGPSGRFGWHWSGPGFNLGECTLFSLYGADAAATDDLCALLPHYLPFRSAGNERNDGPPADGQFWIIQGGQWTQLNYIPASHPPGDGAAGNGLGWDTMSSEASAKNVIAVGAYDPATRAMAPFSSYGPADDGRIKPDLVAPGVGLTSAVATQGAYGPMSGTSMATPVAAGSAALLQELARERFGAEMRASMLKGLLLHTADDILVKGPDYLSGFGLLNVQRAADLMIQQADHPHAPVLVNDVLTEGTTRQFHIIVPAGGVPELRATLCWTDPAGTAQNSLDSPVRSLVNDLDILITGPHTDSPVLAFKRPFAPDPANPRQPAPRARNSRDNTEQVLVENPEPGAYTVTLSHTGPITAPLGGNSQAFSLVMSGHQVANALDFWPDLPRLVRLVQRPTDPLASFDMHIANRTSGTLNLAILANAVADGISAIFVKTDPVLHPGAENTIRVSVTQTGAQYPPGVYQRTVRVQQIGSTIIHEIPVILEIPAATPSLTQQFPGAHDAACDLAYSQLSLKYHSGDGGQPGHYEPFFRRLAAWERRLPHAPVSPLVFPAAEAAAGIELAAGYFVRLHGMFYNKMWVSPNGYITFAAADDTAAPTLQAHFAVPRLSAFFRDLDPAAGGTVSVEQIPQGGVVVTWAGVPSQGGTDSHTFQVQFDQYGNIRITWLELGGASGIAGLSAGIVPLPFAESNLSRVQHNPRANWPEEESAGDLDRTQLILMPHGENGAEGYEPFLRHGVVTLPAPIPAGPPLVKDANGNSQVALTRPVPAFGGMADSMGIAANGQIFLKSGGEPIAAAMPVSLQSNASPSSRFQELPDRFVVTWAFEEEGQSPVFVSQAEWYYDGRVRLTFIGGPHAGGAYFSPPPLGGPGLPPFFDCDISDYPPPPLPEVNVFTLNGHMAEGDAAQRARLRVTRTGFTDDALFTGLSALTSSTASAGDYTGLVSPIIIPAGAAETDIFLDAVPDTLTEGPESLTLRLITMGTVANGPQNEARFTILDKPVDAWLHQHGMTRTHLALDADKDGRSNFEEYATGSDPLVPGLSGSPESSLTRQAATTTLHASAPLNPDASDVSAILQYSTNLAQWTDGPPLAFPENGGLRAEASLTLTGSPSRLFTRVRFRLVP